jgi:anaerobic ribonucleoside-triphosphate reductase activating protein
MSVVRVAQVIEDTEAEGPGRRFAVWVQGCPLRCAGCCNPQMLRFEGGTEMTSEELAAQAIARAGIEGVSLLGGEPFAQAEALADFARRVRAAGLSVMIYSGFTRAELEERDDARGLLEACDLLVDGRYERELPESRRRWIGSTNQQLHFLSDRYRDEDPRFTMPNTVEIRLRKGELVVNGWPALAAQVQGRLRT